MTKITAKFTCIRLFFFFMPLWTRVEERSSEKVGRKRGKRKYDLTSLAFVTHCYFRFSFSFIKNLPGLFKSLFSFCTAIMQ